MIHDLSLALTEYEDDPNCVVKVIFAHGDYFTAGLDPVELQPKLKQAYLILITQINPWGTSSRTRKKPVVVAVQGICYTAGIELMLNAGHRQGAQDNCQFAQMEAQRGILPFWRYNRAFCTVPVAVQSHALFTDRRSL